MLANCPLFSFRSRGVVEGKLWLPRQAIIADGVLNWQPDVPPRTSTLLSTTRPHPAVYRVCWLNALLVLYLSIAAVAIVASPTLDPHAT